MSRYHVRIRHHHYGRCSVPRVTEADSPLHFCSRPQKGDRSEMEGS